MAALFEACLVILPLLQQPLVPLEGHRRKARRRLVAVREVVPEDFPIEDFLFLAPVRGITVQNARELLDLAQQQAVATPDAAFGAQASLCDVPTHRARRPAENRRRPAEPYPLFSALHGVHARILL